MNWKIARIEASSFKAFKLINLDLDTSSLLTLDGPNGYGKTSIFDAIELVLTGQIKRIHNLFSTLMIKQQQNYDDNLFWNTRSGEQDLAIKIEFVNGDRRMVLARHAPVKAFKVKANNRADKYEHFTLYELPDINSNAYTKANKRENEFLDKVFGENFRENFSFLNYLEQGQNRLLHTRVDARKEALGNLFNISDIAAEIENCKSVAAKITKFIGDGERKAKEASLESECNTLREMVQADIASIEYKKLSTAESGPSWDKKNPFLAYDKSVHDQFLESIGKLNNLTFLKPSIRIRAENEKIEADINRHQESLSILATLGTDVNKLAELDKTKNEIDQLTKATAIINKGASDITLEQARSLPGWKSERLKWFESQITKRIDLQIKSSSNTSVAAELANLKQHLLAEHAKLYPEDKVCPLCGNEWEAHESMIEAIELRAQKINNILDQEGNNLIVLITTMNTELTTIEAYIQERNAVLKPRYDETLHNTLMEVKTRLPSIIQLFERLMTEGIPINFKFNDDPLVKAVRLEELSNLMRAKKKGESAELPEDWRETIELVFKDLEDFYILNPQDLKNKESYIKYKANEAQSTKLQKCLGDLQKIQRENNAAVKAKEKINRLQTTLKKAERKYADQTISEIELIFHIYSGRLIQNYQRGLGLFIESRDGKQLRFLTAEKSEHDAVMSMSTGQVSALGLAFFLSLNKVYANIPIILIDDPSQSLDEVNIASLTDLLRCELKHCQLILSSHEEDISAYMRYRFNRAGLTTNSLNMQRLAREAS
ncbi:recombinase RecF [Pseudoalteromonas sp. J010]|uniref:AAA family ATPase n=1 Tax=Pseudoalteromonas sp. J010 TaxID=998465 RepID=UPI000F645E92|nr:AAA family ATPase [Pseudoalteromonas sp. J010]RRS07465.1 recombinase RecF [Pseudoalteromonas sp. J010]